MVWLGTLYSMGKSLEQSWSGVVWHIIFYGVEFGAVLEWCGLAHCILWDIVWSSLGVVWFGTLYSMG